jgi:hypothetical protein
MRKPPRLIEPISNNPRDRATVCGGNKPALWRACREPSSITAGLFGRISLTAFGQAVGVRIQDDPKGQDVLDSVETFLV